MVRTEVAPETVEIFESVASVLKYETSNYTLNDFKIGDIVKSNMLKGIFVVESIGLERIRITEYDRPTSVIPMLPKYLHKLTNHEAIKALYGSHKLT